MTPEDDFSNDFFFRVAKILFALNSPEFSFKPQRNKNFSMLIFLTTVLSASSNETLCGDSTLKAGEICCNNKTCSHKCYQIEDYYHAGYQEVCLSDTQNLFCRYTEYSFLVATSIGILPNIVCLVLSLILSPHTHVMTVIYCLLANMAWSTFIQGIVCKFYLPYFALNWVIPFAIGLCSVLSLTLMFGFDICSNKAGCLKDREYMKQKQMLQEMIGRRPDVECCGLCGTEKCSVTYVRHHISYPKVSYDELRLMHSKNITHPPTPRMFAISFSYFDRPQTYANSTLDIAYGTWQEEGRRVELPMSGTVVYNCQGQYIYDDNMEQNVDNAKVESLEKMFIYDGCFKVAFAETIASGLTSKALVVGDSSVDRFCTSTSGKVLWWISFIFGYSFIFDTVWQIRTHRVDFDSVKHIFADNTGRAKAGEQDHI